MLPPEGLQQSADVANVLYSLFRARLCDKRSPEQGEETTRRAEFDRKSALDQIVRFLQPMLNNIPMHTLLQGRMENKVVGTQREAHATDLKNK